MTDFRQAVVLGAMGRDGLVASRIVSPDEYHTSDNGLLFSSVYVIALKERGELTERDRRYWADKFRECYKPGYPGLLRRVNDDTKGMERPDDFHGVIGASAFVDPEIAREILDYGRHSRCKVGPITLHWNYNDKSPNEFHPAANRTLMQQWIASAQWVCGERVPWWRQLWWFAVVPWSAALSDPRKEGGQDPWVLSWCLMKAVGHENWLTRLGAWIYWKRFYRAWPHGLGEVYKQYLNDKLEVHPFTQYLWEGARDDGQPNLYAKENGSSQAVGNESDHRSP